MEPYIFTFDIGTSSLRTTLIDGAGRRLEETTAQDKYALKNAADGGAELSPAVLKRAAEKCIARTLAASGAPISAIAASCFWHSLIGVDERNRPLTPIYTWADSRCRDDAAKLREELGERQVHARTGCMVRTSFWPAKLTWLRRVDRKLFTRVKRWMSPAEWLYREFTGAAHCGLSMASGTGLLNARTLQWDAALLDRCHITPQHLNELTETPLEPKRLPRFPRLAGAHWYPALGDGAASNLGSGATQPGLAAINVGTSAALRVMKGGPVKKFPFGLFCYRVDAERHVIGGAVSNAGNLRAWCLRELQLGNDKEIERAMAQRPTPEHGLAILPFWSAERAPTWDEGRRSLIEGITFSTSALDILQALTEATYYRIALIADLVIKQERKAPKFIVSGGIGYSPSSLQRLANILNQPIYPNEEPEASIRGAAIYALEREHAPITPLRLSKPIRPQPKIAAIYQRERARHAELEQE